MNIAVIMEYVNNKVGVDTMTISEKELPLNVAPNMVCHQLEALPETGPIYLGKSIRHHCPSDVIVISITEQQKAQLDRVYSTPIEILAPEDSPEDRFQYENEIRNELAIELAKSFI